MNEIILVPVIISRWACDHRRIVVNTKNVRR